MFKIATLNKISENGLKHLRTPNYEISDDCTVANGILVRSAAMHDMDLPDSLYAIARAGAGVNNIPIEKCSEKGIVVFNTPGANANAVKELVLAGLFLASRDIVGGISWAKTLTEDVAKQGEKGLMAEFEQWHGLECIECGSCSYVCPSRRHVAQSIKTMKKQVLAEKRKQNS